MVYQSALKMISTCINVLCLGVSAAAIATPAVAQEPLSAEQILPLVERYCAACHAVPPPSLLPKDSWPKVINAMVELARNTTGTDFIPEDAAHHITALYYGTAPEALPVLPYIDQPSATLTFEPGSLGAASKVPQIIALEPVDLGLHQPGEQQFLVADGERSQVRLATLRLDEEGRPSWQERTLADIAIPVTMQVVDFNGNGRNDILVADLGEFPPNEKRAGKVYVLEQTAEGEFETRLLLQNLGRVTDARAADLTGNGELDLAIAVFGGGQVGEVFWLENQGDNNYAQHQLLPLAGALNLTPVDLNGNGRLDLVTFITQEHEVIIAFINEGQGEFTQVELARAGHPMFGGTSLKIHDMTGNGLPDIVFTNGDAFDTQNDPKPYHGVQWLENRGDLDFRYREIGRFYGAANMAVGDLTGNGEPDLVVSSWHNDWEDPRRQSLVWYENRGKGEFVPRPISGKVRGMVPVVLADLSGDGRLDILAGAFRMDIVHARLLGQSPDADPGPRIMWFKNRAPQD